MPFLQRFKGHGKHVTKVFAKTFDGMKGRIGAIELQLSKEFFSQDTRLSQGGEPWFNNKNIKGEIWK
jgi:hypothetical protein